MISDARKAPWYLDLTPSEMEAVIAAVPALLEVAKAYAAGYASVEVEQGLWSTCAKCRDPEADIIHVDHCPVAPLDRILPGWRTWLTVEQEGRK